MMQCSSQYPRYQRLSFVPERRLAHGRGRTSTRAPLVSEGNLGPLQMICSMSCKYILAFVIEQGQLM